MNALEPLVVIAVVALSSFRVWVLIARDKITERPRTWIEKHWPKWVTFMIHCPWCLGTHIAGLATLGVALSGWSTTPWWLVWPASAALVGLLGERT